MTSYTESFGIVLIEAMSHGVHCLAFTSAEGANDLIEDGRNGYLIENRNYDDMIMKMEELAKDKKKRQKFGEYARTTSLNYSSDVVTKEWIALLKRKA